MPGRHGKTKMRFATVCSGIGAPEVAWAPLGWEPAFCSEIEPFPCAVLNIHRPEVPNYGDMRKYKEWSDAAVELICAGTPCQAFSVAGLRKGLDDPRGNLTLVFLGILRRYRPKWVVWENVPGVLSDKTGAFGAFLGGLAQLGYGFAYRVLDAFYFGVPQRRRRVFVIGHLGNWQYPAAVLFERHSLQGHTPPSRKTGKGFAADLAPSLTSSGRGVERTGESRGQDPVIACFQAGNTKQHGKGFTVDGPAYTLDRTVQSVAGPNMQVRRLTPKECERLQGFPDNFTKIPYKGKSPDQCADGPRYKALGNSMAVPVLSWIGKRIVEVEQIRHPELINI